MKLLFSTNPYKENGPALMSRLAELSAAKGNEVEVAMGCEELTWLIEDKWSDADCIVTIGGDGTILRAMHMASLYHIPVLGINMGRVGFFSEIGTDEFEPALERLLAGNYTVERRSMLRCFVNGETVGDCLNDYSIHRQELSSIVQLDLTVDGDSVGNVMADGLIVATPSGSTAYTMSAGGPVVAPKLDCMLVTPVCPHSLTIRPIVTSADSVVEAQVLSRCRLIEDGQNIKVLEPGDRITVNRSPHIAEFIRFDRRNVFKLLREKLQ